MTPKDNDELREQILFQGEVSFDTYDKDSRTARKLVKIPIDDLMHLISTHVMRARRGFADQLKLAMIDGKASHSVSRINEIIDQELAAAENFDHLKSQRKEDNQWNLKIKAIS